MLPLTVASLIHDFDWKLKPEEVDTTEKFGIALHKAVPLMAIPIKGWKNIWIEYDSMYVLPTFRAVNPIIPWRLLAK
ncbi:hypothetical protein ACS0TY_014508 [Phlomoides rotata]